MSAVVSISKDDSMKHVTKEEAGLRLFIEAFAQLAQRIGTKSLFNDKVNISYKYLKDGKDLIKNITLEYENTYVKYTKIGDNTTIEPSSSFSLDKFGKLLEKEKVLVKTFNTNKSGFLLVGLPVEWFFENYVDANDIDVAKLAQLCYAILNLKIESFIIRL